METHGFLEQALVYLAAGVIAVPLFKRIGLGSVLGYLAAGIVIGPWGLRMIGDPQTVLHFAEFGVVMLLFLIGLELDPQRLWALRRAILGMGSLQVVASATLVTAIAWGLGAPIPVALVAGMGFAMSSTAIALAMLQEKNLLATPGGQAGFAVLLFQDLAVIPLLLTVGLLSEGKTALDWRAALVGIALIAAVWTAGRFLLRPALRYIANARLREVFVGAALLLVIGVALLMEAAGLSMALGAFLAGVILADSEYREELEIDLEPFKGLLLGLFFIAVGMSVDLGLFTRSPLLVLGIALGVVALKAAILFPIANLFGYCGRADAALFALSLSQVGEFAFVLFAAAGPLLPPETLALLNAVVALSMATTPLLFILYERVVARRLAPSVADVRDEGNPVIVAGFGRFGQVVSRVLNGLRVRTTLIDHDPNQVELVRRFGNPAYYGDASRLDVLERAGLARARLLILAIDDEQTALRTARKVRARYPQLAIIARAHSRTDAYEYIDLGIPAVRETFGSALDASELALRSLGHGPVAARRVITQFRRHDEELMEQMAAHRGEVKQLIELNQQGRRDLEKLLTAEIHQRDAGGDEQRGQGEVRAERL
jgi:glutathione-regulated potassium-efflux system ancillary protein KefC